MTGARLTTNWTRFGGNVSDLPDGFLKDLSVQFVASYFPFLSKHYSNKL